MSKLVKDKVGKYTEDNISFYKTELEKVRAKPQMYIGPTDDAGIFTIIREPCDNGVDESIAGRNKLIHIFIEPESFWVVDAGVGIPVKKHPKAKISTLTHVLTALQSSGKISGDAYKASIGCFAGETPIELVDGRTVTIKQLYEEHKNGVKNYVWTISRKTGDLRAQPIDRVLMTGKTRSLVRVNLDNGESFLCTSDHPLYNTALKKVEAAKSTGSSLMAIDFCTDEDGYKIAKVKGKINVRLNRVFADYYGMPIEDCHIHNIDENKINNVGLSADSIVYSQSKVMKAKRVIGKAVKAKRVIGQAVNALVAIPENNFSIAEFNACFDPKQNISAKSLCQYIDLEEFASAVRHGVDPCDFMFTDLSDFEMMQRRNKYDKEETIKSSCWDNATIHRTANRFLRNLNAMMADGVRVTQANYHDHYKNSCGNSWFTGVKACHKAGLNKIQILEAAKESNHKVVSVQPVELDNEVPVYDLSVGIDHNYRLACGVFVGNTHGVGVKTTNALSKEFEVWTYRSDAGGWHYTKFQRGVEVVPVKKVNKAPKLPNGKMPKLGTVIKFSPDEAIFLKAKLNVDQLKTWCELTSFMNAGLKIKLTDAKGKTQEWVSENGVSDYLQKRTEDLKAKPLNKSPLFYKSATIEAAILFADVEGSQVEFFTNTIRNVDEGFHAESFYKAYVKSLEPFKGKLVYTPSDLKDGLLGILNYRIDAPQFSSQTKEKLVDVRMKEPCYKECLEFFTEYFKQNKDLAKTLVARAAELRKKTSDFLKDKKLIKNVKGATKALSTKMADVTNNKIPFTERELYLVEGDSAGGCFVGETELLLEGGGTITYKDLVEDFSNGKQHKVLSYAGNGKYEGVYLDTPHITKYTKTLIKVNVSGKEYICTPDHKWLTLKGWKEAQYLLVGDKIQSFCKIPGYNAIFAVSEYEPDEPVPVFDGTCHENQNYVLGNGCVVHNTAKLARDKNYQATFSLKGKPLNVMEATKDKVNSNKEIAGIFAGIGLDLSAEDPLSKIRFGKFIYLTDPDVDGRHINTLLFGLFDKYTPQFYKEGMIYIVVSPEYLCKYKGKVYFGSNKDEIYNQVGTTKVDIRHIKGWGEIEPEDMREIAFNPKSRKLIRVTAPKDKKSHDDFKALMGKDSSYRKRLLGVI